MRSWTGEEPTIAAPRMVLTDRAGRWATEQVGRCGRTIDEVAVELGCDWHNVNDAVIAYGTALVDDDPDRIGEPTAVGLNETLFDRVPRWADAEVSNLAFEQLDSLPTDPTGATEPPDPTDPTAPTEPPTGPTTSTPMSSAQPPPGPSMPGTVSNSIPPPDTITPVTVEVEVPPGCTELPGRSRRSSSPMTRALSTRSARVAPDHRRQPVAALDDRRRMACRGRCAVGPPRPCALA